MAPKRNSRPVSKATNGRAAKADTTEENVPKYKSVKAGTVKPKPLQTKKQEAAANGLIAPKTHKPYLNKLPVIPDHARPANQLYVWGAGNFGQFGMGSEHLGEFDKPKRNTWAEKKMEDGSFGGEGAGIECIAAGGVHTMFIDEKGTIWTCGVNDDAALGRITQNVPDPEKEGAFLDVDILTSIPHPLLSLVEENFRAVVIAAGDSISAAISSEGELRVWGSFRAMEGSLGFSDGSKYQFLPSRILELPAKDVEKAVSVVTGNNHLVVLTTHGEIYTWGAGEQGQLGRKIMERRKIHGTNPERVVLGVRRKAVVVGAGNYHSFAVDNLGTVWGWGLNSMGQTGTGFEDAETDSQVLRPMKVLGLSKEELGGATIVQIVGGEHHTLFLTSNGRVYSCGRSNGGQLGLPTDHPAFKTEDFSGMVAHPTLVPFPDADDPVVQISSGSHNNAAVTESGALYTWGEGNQGELGIGDETEAKTPTVVVRRTGGLWAATAVSCGGQHTLGLLRKKPT